jgi:hypothetical protein
MSPLRIFAPRTGRHLVGVHFPEHVSYHQWISKPKRDTIEIRAKLKPHWSWLGIHVSPPGARARIDTSDYLGTQGELVRVPVGIHTLYFEDRATGRTVDRKIDVQPADTALIGATLGTPSLFPLVTSIFIPGSGQFYDRSPIEGLGFLVGVAASLYFTMETIHEHDQAIADYQNRFSAYKAATGEGEALQLRNDMLASLDRSHSLAKRSNVMVGVSAVIYLANLLDVYFFHLQDDIVEFPGKFEPGRFSPSLGMNSRGIEFTMKIGL